MSAVAQGRVRACDSDLRQNGVGLAAPAVSEGSIDYRMEPVRTFVMELVAEDLPADLIAASLATLIRDVLIGSASLGIQWARKELGASTQSLPQPPTYRFHRGGDYWEITFDSSEPILLRDMKGLSDIARLLATPGVPVTALELVGASGAGITRSATHDDGLSLDDRLGVPLADEKAIAAVLAAFKELPEEIAAARERGDFEDADDLEEREEQYKYYLGSTTDKKGCARRTPGARDDARVAVTNRITRAIKAIAKHSPDLAVHLDRSIKTGSTVVYQPENPLHWQF